MSFSNILAEQIGNYSNPKSIGSKFRSKRIKPLIHMMNKIHTECGEVSIIDIGGTRKYWNVLDKKILSKYRANITIVNLPGAILPDTEEHFSYIHGNGCKLDKFADNSFHIAHSNSVIEHVGDWENMVRFAQEVRRVAANVYVQTPYFWFPVEPHFMCPFFHWLPRPMRISLIMNFNLGNHKRSQTVHEAASKLENYRLLDNKMLQELFPDCSMKPERFFGITKSLTAIRLG